MKNLLVLVVALGWQTWLWAAEAKPIAVAVGQEFKITLESNPSTGYQWLLAKPLDERTVKLLGSAYRRGGAGGGVGSGGCEVLKFQALGEGKTQIHLKYGRLWEKDAAPARSTNFVVVVSKEAPKPGK